MSFRRVITIGAVAALAVHGHMRAQAQSARAADGERISWPSVTCKGQPMLCERQAAHGVLFSQPGQTRVVLITHGSQGIDSRMYDYVDVLKAKGFAALVIDHWTPRGIDVTHEDYAVASIKGGNELNMVFDSFGAASWLRRARGFTRVGSLGESQGAGAAVMLLQKWLRPLVDRNVARLYPDAPWRAENFDAVVGLYGFCGIRALERDGFVDTPFLMVTGAKDNSTPSKLCEEFIPYMNERGAKAEMTVLAGVYHSFDAPYRMRHSLGPHYGRCNIVADGQNTRDLNSGFSLPGTNIAGVLAKCVSRGYITGNSGNRSIGVPVWSRFLEAHL